MRQPMASLMPAFTGNEASDQISHQTLAQEAEEEILRAGFPVMVSGGFLKRRQRERFEQYRCANVYLVLLQCTPPSEWIESQVHDRSVIGA